MGTGGTPGASSQQMSAAMAMQGVAGLGSAYAQSEAYRAQGAFQKTQSEINARLAEIQGKDTIERGEFAARTRKQETRSLTGSQRAALAAQGIDVDVGTAADIQADTQVIGAKDEMMIRNNAWREAWGLRVEAANSRLTGKMANMAGRNAARNTLLTGGMNAAADFNRAGYYYSQRDKKAEG